MLVFWNEKLVFLAVPKTGTTAIEGALAPRAQAVFRDPPILKHTPYYRYKRFVLPMLEKAGAEGLQTVAVVRHPIDWLSSWYRYRNRDDLVGSKNSTRGITFDEFVVEYCEDKPAPFANVGSQAKFLAANNGPTKCDYVFRYEAQPKLIEFLETRLNVKLELKELNVSPRMDVSLLPEVEALLRHTNAADFALWEAAQH